ncbi:hypothetical protein HRbin11_00508 [bacterium HR11]|nr:hypothetical protein HRbin11_00508 [bacterium HR11]
MARKNPRKSAQPKATAPATPPEQRVQVTSVVVYLQYPDGTTRTVTYDPRRVEALFWSRRAVTEILGPYYDGKNILMDRDHCLRCFGPTRTQAIMGNQPKVRVTPDLLERLWDAPDDQGCCIGILAKQDNSNPGG